MGTLTPRQALENRIRADARNIDTISPMSSAMTRAWLVADCAVRWQQARETSGTLSAEAKRNLERATRLYAEVSGEEIP